MYFRHFHTNRISAVKLPQRLVWNVHTRSFLFSLACAILLLLPNKTKAQVSADDYEEISVYLAVQGIGGYDVTAVYRNDQVYLPVAQIFQCLKINQKTSEFNDTISGFFLDENNKYIISMPGHSVFVDGKLVKLTDEELINFETTGLSLRVDQYGRLFGLDCKFNFSSLTVELKTAHELPVIKELRLEQMRKNISRLKGEIKVDTNYKRRYHVFRGGMADWAIYSTQVSNGPTENRAMLAVGTEFLGGETNIELNYSSKNHFEKRQQQYHWRWANNDTKVVKQVIVGKIASKSIASIYSPLVGAVVTNTPTSFRRSFGSYTMSDFTEPGWTVELYINNVVVDFTTADASGFFKFDIPLVYGSSNVMLKFYGPWGEERQREQTINVPYNFLPKGEFQYTAAGALVQDTVQSFFSRTEVNYGINRHVTVGGGYEYLSSITSSPSIPFVTGSAQIFNNLLFNGEYAYGVRTKALFSYNTPNNFVFDIDYTKYANEQKAIIFNYLEERKIRMSIPVKINKFMAYTRFSYGQNILKETNYSTAEATFSTFVKGVSANFTGNANWLRSNDLYVYGNLGLGFRFFRTLSFRPQAQYDFTNKELVFTKVELENNFSPKANLSLVWENNIRNNINSVQLTFRYDFSFAQASVSAWVSKNRVVTGQNARGSFAFGSGNGRIIADMRTQVGRAGLSIVPFLDINNNNLHDDDEPMVSGLNTRINGGRILPDSRDSIIRIMDLEPFASYMLEFSDTQFDNIAWQIKNKTISIMMDPNQFKLLLIPVKVMGEINGMVYIRNGANVRAQGRIQVNIFDQDDNLVARTQSESDGYFNYLGLAPGTYYAEVDKAQLAKLKYVSVPKRFDFEIHQSENGDIIDNIEFQLMKPVAETQAVVKEEPKPVVVEEKKPVVVEEKKPVVKEAVVTIPPADIAPAATATHQFFIQAGAFKNKKNADRLVKDLTKLTSQKWFIETEDGWYKVRTGYFGSREAANSAKESLNTKDISYYISELPNAANQAQPQAGTEFEQHKQQATETQKPEVKTTKETASTPLMDCDSANVNNGYFVQAGAFMIRANAEKLAAKLIKETGKPWFIACGNGFYKVRLGYFTTKDEARKLEKSLRSTGIKFYVNKPKGVIIKDQPKAETLPATQKPAEIQPVTKPEKAAETKVVPTQLPEQKESKPKVTEPEKTKETKPAEIIPVKTVKKTKDGKVVVPPIDEISKAEPTKFFIQAGAFDSKVHAERLASDLLKLTLKRWFIVYDDGLYKVRLGYFTSKEAAKRVEETLNTTEVPYYVDGISDVARPIELKDIPKGKDQKQNNGDNPKELKGKKNNEITPATKQEPQGNAIDKEKTKAGKRNGFLEIPLNDKYDKGLDEHKFYIQADAFTNRAAAEQLVTELYITTRKEWFIVAEDGLFKVRLGYFGSKDEAKYVEGTLNTPGTYYYIDELPAE